MQGKQLFKSFIIIVLSILSLPAMAEWSKPHGWYLGLNYGIAKASNRNYGAGIDAKKSMTGINGNVGYKFNPYVATELGYTKFSDGKVRDSSGNKIAIDKRAATHLAVKGIVPTNWGIEPFAKIGVTRISSNTSITDAAAATTAGFVASSHTTLGLYLGAGAQYNYSSSTALTLQWARSKGNSKTGNVDLYSLGFTYLFD